MKVIDYKTEKPKQLICLDCGSTIQYYRNETEKVMHNMTEYSFVLCPICGKRHMVGKVDFKTIHNA